MKDIVHKCYTDILEEASSDGVECLSRPREHPVNAGVVDEAWETAAASTQYIPCRGHAQHNMQVINALAGEVVPTSFPEKEFSFDLIIWFSNFNFTYIYIQFYIGSFCN